MWLELATGAQMIYKSSLPLDPPVQPKLGCKLDRTLFVITAYVEVTLSPFPTSEQFQANIFHK